MQRLPSKWSVVNFIVVLVVGALSVLASPVAAQIPKSGTVKVHSGWFSAGETKKVGEKRLYWVGEYWGVSFNDEGKGFMHQMAWNCPALSDIMDSLIQTKGNCTLTDPDGDKLYASWTGKGAVGGEFAGNVDMSGGTGKYTGIQGTWEFHCWGVGPDGQLYCHQQANYKLP
jgi:hypothetical protein